MGMNVIDGTRIPVGFDRSIDVSTSNLGITIPATARVAIIQAVLNDINWRDDGTAAAATASTGGMLLQAGASFLYVGDLTKLSIIEAVADSTAGVNISYYK